MSRDPGWYYKTKFLIDKLHAVNNKSCSPAYDCKSYSQQRVHDLNTQGCEQKNARLGSKAVSICQMNLSHANTFLRCYLCSINIPEDTSLWY